MPIWARPIGNRTPTPKLANHKQKVAAPIPIPRTCSGKISDISSQVIGLIAPWKNAKNSIIIPIVANARNGEPAGSRLAKVTPVIATVEPINPTISIGRRGTCFNNCNVTIVAATAVTPLAMLAIKALSRPKPVICKIEVP